MTSAGRIHIYTDKNGSHEQSKYKQTQKKVSNSKNSKKKNRLPPPPGRHRLIQFSYRGYNSPATNVSTSTTAVATAAAYAAYNRQNASNTNSLLGDNNAVNIVAAAATGYGNNISPTLKNNNPALKSLSLSSNTTALHNSIQQSPHIKMSSNNLKETDTNHDNDYFHSSNEKANEISSPPSQSKGKINNKIKKKNSNSRFNLKQKNSSNTSLNSNSSKGSSHSSSKINNALKLLSDADHYKEDDLECIPLRKEAVEVLEDYQFDKSHVAQLYQVGLHYVYEKDFQKAFDIFKQAHNYHYPAATFQLARYYESGILESVPKDNKMAQKYYRQAALNSYCKAMYRLSMAYLHGEIGCKKSKNDAIRWLHRCTWSIDSKEQMVVGEAMYQLSKFYEKGMTNDKEKDQKSAASYLRMAAEKYCVDAQDYLGYCYQHGHLTYPCNMKKAIYWFTQAALGHCIEAKISLCHLYLTGSPPDIPQEDTEALYWIRRAANSTHVNNSTQAFSRAKAQYILGWFLEEGIENILDKNPKEAIKWYLKASQEGVSDAKSALKHFTQEEIDEVIEEEEKHNKAGYQSSKPEADDKTAEFHKCGKEYEDDSDYSLSEYSDDNSLTGGHSSHSLNIKIMNIASFIFKHRKKHRYNHSFSNIHGHQKNSEVFSDETKNYPSNFNSDEQKNDNKNNNLNTTTTATTNIAESTTTLTEAESTVNLSKTESVATLTEIENTANLNEVEHATNLTEAENSSPLTTNVSIIENTNENVSLTENENINQFPSMDYISLPHPPKIKGMTPKQVKEHFEKVTNDNHNIHMEELKRKIKKANNENENENENRNENKNENENGSEIEIENENENENRTHTFDLESDDTYNLDLRNKSFDISMEEIGIGKDFSVTEGHKKSNDNNNDTNNPEISKKKKQYIAKLNSELVKSMMTVKSDHHYFSSISGISSSNSQPSEDKEKMSKGNLHHQRNDSVNSSRSCTCSCTCSCSSSYCSHFSEECCNSAYYSNCCYSCSCGSSCCPSSKPSYNKNRRNSSTKILNGPFGINASSSVVSGECSSNNFEVMSQDSSVSSVTSYEKQQHSIKAHIHSSQQKFAGYDKSQITSSDRMKAYSHYQKIINNQNKNDLESSNIKISSEIEEEKMSIMEATETKNPIPPVKSKILKRRHSHSGLPLNKINPMTPLNDNQFTTDNNNTDNNTNNNNNLKKRSKSSQNFNELKQKYQLDEEDGYIRVNHIKGLSDTESEISYVCPVTANIFDTFEKKEEHHDYGYNDERHQSNPKTVVKSCQHSHSSYSHSHGSSKHKYPSFSFGHHHHHHHHHHQHQSQSQNQQQHQHHHHHRHHSHNHHNILKLNLHHSHTKKSSENTDLPISSSLQNEKDKERDNTKVVMSTSKTEDEKNEKMESIVNDKKDQNESQTKNKQESKESTLGKEENCTSIIKEEDSIQESTSKEKNSSIVDLFNENVKEADSKERASVKSDTFKNEKEKIFVCIKRDFDKKLRTRRYSSSELNVESPSPKPSKFHHLSLRKHHSFHLHHHSLEEEKENKNTDDQTTSIPKKEQSSEPHFHHHHHGFLNKLNVLHLHHLKHDLKN